MDNKWVSNYINELTSTNEVNDSTKALNTAKTEITEKVTEFKNTKTARILTKRWKGKDMEQYFQDKAATNKANPNRKSDILKIYKGLNKGDLIDIKYDSAIRKGDEYKSFVVSKGKTKVGKQKVERITLQIKDKPKTVKFYLYNRNNNIYFAIGDMGASIVDIKKPTNEVVNEELSSAELVSHMKLIGLALKAMPGSAQQKKIIKQINILRIKGGMKPLKESVNESKVSNSDILDVIDSIQGLIKNIKNDNSKKSSKLFSMAGPLVKELHKLVESVNTPIK